MENTNPLIYESSSRNRDFDFQNVISVIDEEKTDPLTSQEIFELLRYINDPEHPLTLEQLNVINVNNVSIDVNDKLIRVFFTPTIPHCTMATLIGLCIKVKLIRSVSTKYKFIVLITPQSHQSEVASTLTFDTYILIISPVVNRQLNDKERVAAALENKHLIDVVNKCVNIDSCE